MPRFVLEIGTEELPPRFFPPAMAQLREEGERMLHRARLASRTPLTVYGTPRRLVLIAEDLAERQAPQTREERGPAARVAFDQEGKPTKAALGFARRLGLDPAALERRDTEQGEYVFAVIQAPELPAKDALAPLLPGLIAGLSFPKTMRWGTGKLRFGRPIRWLLALIDTDIVEFELDGIKSGRLTRGHPVLAEGLPAGRVAGMFEVASADGYEDVLLQKFVLVRDGQRRLEVRQRVEALSTQVGGIPLGVGRTHPTIDVLLERPEEFARLMADDLLLQTVFLVEWPTAALGRFETQFLTLPEPVLIEEMQHIQSYFPLRGQEASREFYEALTPGQAFWGRPDRGRLMPCFIAVRDGDEDHLDTIVAGWENVLRAKLIDASFFYEQDRKRPLADRVEDLRGVVFQERLGTMYDKTQRVQAIAAELAEQDSLGAADRAALDRAALICKADLTTEVVTELSGLQGVMGGVYARAVEPRETDEVADAIADHYHPRFSDDEIPGTFLSQLLALADKLDTLAALFAIGAVPTGSADPFGLRREAAGVVSILIGADLFVSTRRLLEVALVKLEEQTELTRPRNDIIEDVLAFIGQRLENTLRDEGIRYDLVDAALAVGVDPLRMAYERAHALRRVSAEPYFLETVIACTRPMNISKGFDDANKEVDEKLLEERGEPAEKALWAAYKKVHGKVKDKVLIGQELDDLFGDITAFLVDPIDRFFTDVLVMHEDPALRRNRLALCWSLSKLFRRLADFSLIVQT